MFLEAEVAAAVFPHFRLLLWAADLTSPEGVIQLKLLNVERLTGEIVWVRYEVVKGKKMRLDFIRRFAIELKTVRGPLAQLVRARS